MAGRRLFATAGIGALALALVLVVLVRLAGDGTGSVAPSHRPSSRAGSTSVADRSDAARVLLGRLEDLLERGTVRQVAALAPPGDEAATAELADLRANVRRLRITDLDLSYVQADGGRADEGRADGGRADGGRADGERADAAQDWVAEISVTWRLAGVEARPSTMRVPLVLRERGRAARFVSARQGGAGAVPLWLLGRVGVSRSSSWLVMSDDPASLRRFSGLADRAVRDVRRVLPRWRGRLVIEVPGDQRRLDRVLGARAGDYTGIAALTTTVDRSTSATAPVHVFVNPRVFDPLGPRGSQIVISHEATHVATGAALSSMPSWLLEGFADYVALDHVDLPVSVTASQVLRQVRRHGAPAHLPGAAEFEVQDAGLGATYESAWLACRLLARTYGEQRLVDFYRASDRDSATGAAFRSVLGTDPSAFTRAWRRELVRLAR